MQLDRIDKKILQILQQQGDISNLDLAEKVALSPSPCLRRVKQLHTAGYIKRYVALLDQALLGLNLTVMVTVGLTSHTQSMLDEFEKSISAMPEVIECLLITGQAADYMLKVVVADLDAYHQFLMKKLTCMPDVSNVQSSFVLKHVADKTELPVM